MTDEDDVALQMHSRLFGPRKCHDVIEVSIDGAGHAHGETAIDDRLDDRHLLKVGAIVTSRFDTSGGELRREVFGSQRPATR